MGDPGRLPRVYGFIVHPLAAAVLQPTGVRSCSSDNLRSMLSRRRCACGPQYSRRRDVSCFLQPISAIPWRMRASNCDRCYRRKSKCDRLKPCTSCARANAECTYLNYTSRAKAHSRGHNTALRPPANASTSAPLSRSPQESDSPVSLSRRAGPVSEVSYLSLNAAGERSSYLGSSSGVLFADLVQSALDVTVTRPASPDNATDTSPMAAASYARRDDELPPEAHANELVRAYLNHDAIIYPFLHFAFLEQIVRRFYHEPRYYATKATALEVFCFNMVLAIATSRVQKSQLHVASGPEWFNSRAMAEVNSVFALEPTEHLQAVLLLCQYRSCSPIRDNSASMWHLVGIAARLCIELGLHRESSYPLTCVDAEVSSDATARSQIQEIRRRCFWTLVSMDRIVSIVLGRPFALHDNDIDTALPSEESDRIMARGNEMLRITRISVSNKIFRYRLLCGRISMRLHGKRSETAPGEEDVRATQFLAEQLQEWHRSEPQLRGLQMPDLGQDQPSCYLSPEWYDLLAANASLMLWRPYFSVPGLTHNCHGLEQIFESASTAIVIYADLHRSRKINYTWITLQSVFLAGLSYVASISQHFRQRRLLGPSAAPVLIRDPSLGDVVRTTRACSRVLIAVGERWDIPRHCHEVFDRLSDAVLADAIHWYAASNQLSSHTHLTRNHSADTTEASGLSTIIQRDPNTTASPLPPRNHLTWDFDDPSMSSYNANYISTLTEDTDFLSCFDDLQRLYDGQYLDDSVMQLSQDWLGSLGMQSSH